MVKIPEDKLKPFKFRVETVRLINHASCLNELANLEQLSYITLSSHGLVRYQLSTLFGGISPAVEFTTLVIKYPHELFESHSTTLFW